MAEKKDNESLLDSLHAELLERFTPEEIRYLKLKLIKSDNGGPIDKATLVFVCPDTGELVHTNGFTASPYIDEKTKDVSAILTAECNSCGKEHPVTSLSFNEMLLNYEK